MHSPSLPMRSMEGCDSRRAQARLESDRPWLRSSSAVQCARPPRASTSAQTLNREPRYGSTSHTGLHWTRTTQGESPAVPCDGRLSQVKAHSVLYRQRFHACSTWSMLYCQQSIGWMIAPKAAPRTSQRRISMPGRPCARSQGNKRHSVLCRQRWDRQKSLRHKNVHDAEQPSLQTKHDAGRISILLLRIVSEEGIESIGLDEPDRQPFVQLQVQAGSQRNG